MLYTNEVTLVKLLQNKHNIKQNQIKVVEAERDSEGRYVHYINTTNNAHIATAYCTWAKTINTHFYKGEYQGEIH